MSTKIVEIGAAAALVPHGATVAIAGPAGARRPLALVRELHRLGRSDLRLVSWAAGPEAELLGLDARIVPIEAFRAGALGLGFTPVPEGGDLQVESPFGGPPVAAIAALRPDVALIHAEAADDSGTLLLADDPGTWSRDRDLLASADVVIASVEQLVSARTVDLRRREVLIAGTAVAAVVHAPFGSHPLAFPGRYPADADAPSTPRPPQNHWSYLDAVGVARLITRATGPRQEAES